MLNLKEFIVKNIVNGIKNGTWSKEYGNIMAVNYIDKGHLTKEDVASIDAQITAWEAEQTVKKEVVEDILTEEVTELDEEVTKEPAEDTGEETKETEAVEAETETEIEENETVE